MRRYSKFNLTVVLVTANFWHVRWPYRYKNISMSFLCKIQNLWIWRCYSLTFLPWFHFLFLFGLFLNSLRILIHIDFLIIFQIMIPFMTFNMVLLSNRFNLFFIYILNISLPLMHFIIAFLAKVMGVVFSFLMSTFSSL